MYIGASSTLIIPRVLTIEMRPRARACLAKKRVGGGEKSWGCTFEWAEAGRICCPTRERVLILGIRVLRDWQSFWVIVYVSA